ncbi:hypothetical protein Tco_0502175 [Tanacetum coccineum]
MAQGYTQEEGIDYDKVFAPVARIEAISLDTRGVPIDKTFLFKGTGRISAGSCVTAKTSHLNAVKRIFKYLKGKPHLGLCQTVWQTATANILLMRLLELPQLLIPLCYYNITEASIRNKLQLADASGITMLPNNEIFEGMGHMGNMKRGFRGAPRPLLPAMLLVATTNPSAVGQEGEKAIEGILNRRNVVLSDSEEEEPKDQGRKSQDDPLVFLVQGLVTPAKTTVNTSGEEQKVVTSLDFQEEVSTGYAEGVNTGSIKVSTVSGKVSTVSGQEEASLAEAIRLDTLEKEEKVKQVHLDSLLVQRLAEEEELNEQQKQRRAQVQFKAQHYTNEDWDLIRAKDCSEWDMEAVLSEEFKFEEEKEGILISCERAKKDDESTKKTGKRRKQIARKGLHSDKTDEDESEASKDADPILGTNIPINPVPVAIKPPSIATYKIIKQGKEGVYQIVREDGTDIVYINFGAMLKDITRDDLTELYRIVMNRYGMNGPEDELEKVLWEYLKNMFEAPLSTDPIWSLLDKKLQGGKPNEDCYRLLKMMEKQAGIRKHKGMASPGANVPWYEFSNQLMADNLAKNCMVINSPYLFHVNRVDMVHHPPWSLPFLGAKGLTSPEQTATGVNTPESDENSLKYIDLIADMKGCEKFLRCRQAKINKS